MRIYSDRLHVGRPTHVGPLSIFPLWSETKTSFQYVATQPQGLAIGELEDPQVDTLQVRNQSTETVLIPEGTIVRGNRQTRALARDILVAPRQARRMPVVCVEQGRWGDDTDASITGRVPVSVFGAIRDINRDHVTDGRMRQSDVWSRVNRYERSYGSRMSNSLDSIVNDMDGDRIRGREDDSQVDRLRNTREEMWSQISRMAANPLAGQNGVMIGMLGHPVQVEFFADRAAFRAQLTAMFRAALTDGAIIPVIPTSTRNAHLFADAIMDNELTFASNGSRLLRGGDSLVDIRSYAHRLDNFAALHTGVVNRRHELVLAS